MYGGCKIPVERSSLLLLPQKEKAKENWRISHYERLNNKYCSRNAIRASEMGGACGTYAGFGGPNLTQTDQLELTGYLGG